MKEFQYFITRNYLIEDGEQLVEHYLDGLRAAMQQALAVHPLWTVMEAYQCASAIENTK